MTTQKEKIKIFKETCQQTDKVCKAFLQKHNWSVQNAVEAWFSQGAAVAITSKDTLGLSTELFRKYEDEKDVIGIDGTLALLSDIMLDPADPLVLLIALEMNCKLPCEFKLVEWVAGCSKLNITTLDSFIKSIPSLRIVFSNELRRVYEYTFAFAKDPTQKSLDYSIACQYWRLLFPVTVSDTDILGISHVENWCVYIEQVYQRPVNRDSWFLFYEFVTTIGPDFETYDPEAAWPSLIDSFVTEMKKTH